MLPASTERILSMLKPEDLVLDVGGWAGPFNRANYVLDMLPHATRGRFGSYGEVPEHFTPQTWVIHDICSREPWPFEDGFFDFALCVTTLEDLRDPVWVCAELSRVAKRGYVEVPTVEAELIYGVQGPWLGYEHHRWFCTVEDGGLVFLHKSHAVHFDWRLRVLPRWAAEMRLEDQLQPLFWDGELPARERLYFQDYPLDELVDRVRRSFQPTALELRQRELRERLGEARARAWGPLRKSAERLLAETRRRRR